MFRHRLLAAPSTRQESRECAALFLPPSHLSQKQKEGGAAVEKEIKTVQDYLMAILPYQQRAFAQIHRFGTKRPALLFRGQKENQKLRAKIADVVANNEISRPIGFERERLAFLRRQLNVSREYSDWDLIAIAQHHGIATRFLDWTSNSLIALWFALGSGRTPYSESGKSVVYLLETCESDFEVPVDERSPIPEHKGSRTVIFIPQMIDSRISAQDSYLMRQVYEYQSNNGENHLVIRPVDVNPTFNGRVYRVPITDDEEARTLLLDELAKYGYANNSILPDANDWEEIKKACDDLKSFFKKENEQ